MSQTINRDGWVRNESTGTFWRYNPSNDTIMLQHGRSMPRPSHMSREQCLRTLAGTSSRYTPDQTGSSTDPRSVRAPRASPAMSSSLAPSCKGYTTGPRRHDSSDDETGVEAMAVEDDEDSDSDDDDRRARGDVRSGYGLYESRSADQATSRQAGSTSISTREAQYATAGRADITSSGVRFNLRASLNQRQVDVTGLWFMKIFVAKGRSRNDIRAKISPLLQMDLSLSPQIATARVELWYNSCTNTVVPPRDQGQDEAALLNNMRTALVQASQMPPERIEQSGSSALFTANVALGHPEGKHFPPFLTHLDSGAHFNSISKTALERLGMDERYLTERPSRTMAFGDGRIAQVSHGLNLKWQESGGEAFQDWFYVLDRSLNPVVLGGPTCEARGLLIRGANSSSTSDSVRSSQSAPLQYAPMQFLPQTPEEARKQQKELDRIREENRKRREERLKAKAQGYSNQSNSGGYGNSGGSGGTSGKP